MSAVFAYGLPQTALCTGEGRGEKREKERLTNTQESPYKRD